MNPAMRGLLALLMLLAAGLVHAQEGEPVTEEVVRDREFGVSARHFGLERRVEMFQWRAKDGGYERTWSETPIDSTGYSAGHENPAFPMRGRRWLAQKVTLDDKPVDRSVVEQFGQWRLFRPNFSALPGNLTATFQPEGDGLGSAENPLDPQIGDLRIGWRELTLPALKGRVSLERGTWFPIAGDPLPDEAPLPAFAPAAMSAMPLPTATLLFAALHAVLLMILTIQVVRWRANARVGIGTGESRELARWVRVHGNFTEYVPLTLLLLALLEMAGVGRQWIFTAGTVLLIGRVLHAYGLGRHAGTSYGRFIGMVLTMLVLGGAAIGAFWIAMR